MQTPNRLPTEQEFKDWLEHPATQAIHRTLRNWQQGLKDNWASGSYTDMSQYGTAILNAKAIGTCEALDRVIEIDFEQLVGESDD